MSDEIYRAFCYDAAFTSPAEFNPQTLVLDGFSKSHAITGWRLGFAHGPAEIIEAMTKIQQFTFVCAPQPAQHGALEAMDTDMSAQVADYRNKRDLVCEALEGVVEFVRPSGGFYVFPKTPPSFDSTGAFIEAAIGSEGLLIGLDFSSGMLAKARRKAERREWTNVRLIQADAGTISEELIRDHAGVDRVDKALCTLGFTVIPDWAGAFERSWRLLKPGGRFLFYEHVASPGGPKRWVQDRLNPLWRFATTGCNLNREIGEAIASAGFDSADFEAFDLSVGIPITIPNIVGRAVA